MSIKGAFGHLAFIARANLSISESIEPPSPTHPQEIAIAEITPASLASRRSRICKSSARSGGGFEAVGDKVPDFRPGQEVGPLVFR